MVNAERYESRSLDPVGYSAESFEPVFVSTHNGGNSKGNNKPVNPSQVLVSVTPGHWLEVIDSCVKLKIASSFVKSVILVTALFN